MVSYPETSVDPVKPYIKTRGGYSWEFLVGVCHRYIDCNASQKDFLKSVRNLHISLLVSYSFGIETIICSYSPVVSSKQYPIPDQNGQSLYPFSDQNDAKIIPFKAAQICMAYIKEYPPGIKRASLLGVAGVACTHA